jgi:hypothetical protein
MHIQFRKWFLERIAEQKKKEHEEEEKAYNKSKKGKR